ncbi:hypothetical protein MRX96_052238 [Rhipicephalus microplus]
MNATTKAFRCRHTTRTTGLWGSLKGTGAARRVARLSHPTMHSVSSECASRDAPLLHSPLVVLFPAAAFPEQTAESAVRVARTDAEALARRTLPPRDCISEVVGS